ncbi:hypothetical protein ALC57_01879 [Trachymyrmex cornetzi]|uniref:HAT C-terminal dimerisation domain-containing protein n=1 Tax=Trachymyrmex cornetzi TaxID=471704 RepID=A0A151JPI1_9HYME|nr:hypothetical protein ALC57_01879 [Trachymyrmex cornetzi]
MPRGADFLNLGELAGVPLANERRGESWRTAVVWRYFLLETSFSCLKRIKNYLRSIIGQTRLNSLAILTIEAEILNSLNCDEIIHQFAIKKSRRKNM